MKETAELATTLLRTGIKNKSKVQIMAAYDLVETDEFSWDDLDDLFNEFFEELVEKANDIIYS